MPNKREMRGRAGGKKMDDKKMPKPTKKGGKGTKKGKKY